MSAPHLRKVAVIGGGASAALFVAALKDGPYTVDIYDRSGRFARGIAYATTNSAHLLNVRAGNMSGFQDDRDHFARWAAAFGYGPDDFVPRTIYGRYLEELLEDATTRIPITRMTGDVTSSIRTDRGFHIDGKDYDDVILATGNVVPLGPRINGAVKGYHADPWSLTQEDIAGARRIALIGTGLSAVDAVLTLRSLGYTGAITMISRRTLLPAPHTHPAIWPHVPLSPDDADKPLSHLMGMVRLHVREAAAQDIPWQAVIDSLRPVTNALWQYFSDAQRARFSKHLLTIWNIHRHRMAPSIAQQITALQSSGDLSFIRDAVQGVAQGPVVHGGQSDYPFDAVINCMGYRYHQEGRSFDYSYAIGPARFGDLFETTAIPEIRAQAREIALSIRGALPRAAAFPHTP